MFNLPPLDTSVAQVPATQRPLLQREQTFIFKIETFEPVQVQFMAPTSRKNKQYLTIQVVNKLFCHKCKVTETTQWRAGSAGKNTLCNSCGIRYRKEQEQNRKNQEQYKQIREKMSFAQLLNPTDLDVKPKTP